ncbi:MAG: glycosyltransferase [Bacteroidota bacterium]
MRILVANYRYFVSGGPERYMFNIMRKLEEKGHKIVPFSVHNLKNAPTQYDKYFVEPIGGRDKTYFKEYTLNPRTIFQLIGRTFYSFETKRAIQRVIKDEQIDSAYVLHYLNKLSPSIIVGAKQSGVRVVVRLSDYGLLCPRFDFLYNEQPCDACMVHGLGSAIKRKCVQNSTAASIVRVCSMIMHRMFHVYDKVDTFVCPSKFLANILIDHGFPAKKIVHIPTFVNTNDIEPKYNGDYVLYCGRLVEEKGVQFLIKAFDLLDDAALTLKIVGDDTTPLASKLKEFVVTKGIRNVQFLGFKEGNELARLLQGAKYLVVPSVWYDNMPNVILEAFAHGKPVLASNIGSLPEVVDDGTNGYLFAPGDAADLASKMKFMTNDVVASLGVEARKKAETVYPPDKHYEKLIEVMHGQDCRP